MKPKQVEREVVLGLPEGERSSFHIADTAHIMRLVRDALYSDKELAVVREYCTNAWDAHIQAGKPDVPIEVQLPTHVQKELVIRDYGLGLSEEDVRRVFTGLGASDKRDTDDQVGTYGLGAKSAMAYTDTYFIVSVFEGVQKEFVCYDDEQSMGQLQKISEIATDEPSGITIRISVATKDIGAFETAARKVLPFLDPLPITNIEIQEHDVVRAAIQKAAEGDHLILDAGGLPAHSPLRYRNRVLVLMGCVAYPVDISNVQEWLKTRIDALREEEEEEAGDFSEDIQRKNRRPTTRWRKSLGFLVSCAASISQVVVLRAPIGAVDIVPNREQLAYSARTREFVLEACMSLYEQKVVRGVRDTWRYVQTAPSLRDAMWAVDELSRSLRFLGNQELDLPEWVPDFTKNSLISAVTTLRRGIWGEIEEESAIYVQSRPSPLFPTTCVDGRVVPRQTMQIPVALLVEPLRDHAGVGLYSSSAIVSLSDIPPFRNSSSAMCRKVWSVGKGWTNTQRAVPCRPQLLVMEDSPDVWLTSDRYPLTPVIADDLGLGLDILDLSSHVKDAFCGKLLQYLKTLDESWAEAQLQQGTCLSLAARYRDGASVVSRFGQEIPVAQELREWLDRFGLHEVKFLRTSDFLTPADVKKYREYQAKLRKAYQEQTRTERAINAEAAKKLRSRLFTVYRQGPSEDSWGLDSSSSHDWVDITPEKLEKELSLNEDRPVVWLPIYRYRFAGWYHQRLWSKIRKRKYSEHHELDLWPSDTYRPPRHDTSPKAVQRALHGALAALSLSRGEDPQTFRENYPLVLGVKISKTESFNLDKVLGGIPGQVQLLGDFVSETLLALWAETEEARQSRPLWAEKAAITLPDRGTLMLLDTFERVLGADHPITQLMLAELDVAIAETLQTQSNWKWLESLAPEEKLLTRRTKGAARHLQETLNRLHRSAARREKANARLLECEQAGGDDLVSLKSVHREVSRTWPFLHHSPQHRRHLAMIKKSPMPARREALVREILRRLNGLKGPSTLVSIVREHYAYLGKDAPISKGPKFLLPLLRSAATEHYMENDT